MPDAHHFPFPPVEEPGRPGFGASREVSSLVHLSSAAAEKLRRYVSRRDVKFEDLAARSEDRGESIVADDDTVRASRVLLLPNGWMRISVVHDAFYNGRARVDVLLAPGEVLAVSSEILSSSYFDDQERDAIATLWSRADAVYTAQPGDD